MTAIYGVCRTDGASPSADIAAMAAALAPYGTRRPLAWIGGTAALGKRLFPTLAEDRFADPLEDLPQSASINGWQVAADVRLTERDELARQLGLPGDGAGMSDSTIVAHALARWGDDAIDRIYGPFALAAWHEGERRLLLARDYIGDRPLFFHHGKAGLAFASIPEGLRVLPYVPDALDEGAYAHFLRFLSLPRGMSVFAGIDEVPQGHLICFEQGQFSVRRTWQPDLSPLRLPRQQDYEAAVASALEDAVAAALRGVDGHVGTELSSGFDSTAVATTAARQLARCGGKVTAFTAVPGDGPLEPVGSEGLADESELSRLTAAMHPNMELVRVAPRAGVLAATDRMHLLQPLPMLNLCNERWIAAIQDEAQARGVRVLLHGSMGNGSLSEDGVLALPDLLRQRRPGAWWRLARALARNGRMRWRGIVWNSLSPFTPQWLWQRVEAANGRPPASLRRFSLLPAGLFDAIGARAQRRRTGEPGELSADEFMRDAHLDSVATRLSYVVARATGGPAKTVLAQHGLDLRDPTADRRLYELALRIPVERLIWNGEPRAILRKVLADRAPPEVLHTRRRGFQSADWAAAVARDRAAIADEIERIAMFEPARRLLDLDRLRALVRRMPEDGSPDWFDEDTMIDMRFALLRTISAASHMRHAARSNC